MKSRFGCALCCLAVFLVAPLLAQAKTKTLRIKVCVDDEEGMPDGRWQERLKTRIERASRVINSFCDLKFGAVEFEKWDSDDRVNDLNRSLREFETEVPIGRVNVVIGFTSQYTFRRGHNALGGTRGPLHTHILIREGSPNLNETERIEAVVHEIGHYLGAVHSNDPISVMRPSLGGNGRNRTGRVGFDVENTAVIRLITRDIIDLRSKRLHELSTDTKERLIPHYQRLAKQLPKDTSAPRYIKFVEHALKFRRVPR